jgi:hypothetical protein
VRIVRVRYVAQRAREALPSRDHRLGKCGLDRRAGSAWACRRFRTRALSEKTCDRNFC